MEQCLEKVWFDQQRYEQAEASYQRMLAKRHAGLRVEGKAIGSVLNTEIEKAMTLIGESLKVLPTAGGTPRSRGDLEQRVTALERENSQLKSMLSSLQSRLGKLEEVVKKLTGAPPVESAPPPATNCGEDDDFDLFGSEDEEEDEQRQKRLHIYAEKKANKPQVVAKSNILLDVKPWDDETNIGEMEELVRSITQDGLLWGASKHVPVAYGIKKLQISCVVEDDKVGTDFLEEAITAFEEHVQSVDIVAFNKI